MITDNTSGVGTASLSPHACVSLVVYVIAPQTPKVKAKKTKLKPIRGICQLLGQKLARDDVMKPMTKKGDGSGGEGTQAGKTQGQSAGQSFLGTRRTQAGTFEERGGEAATRPSPPPWLEVELCKSASRLSPDQWSAHLRLHCGARTTWCR